MFSAKGKDKAEGDARKVRAQKGIPLDIHWKTSYKINIAGLLGNVPPHNDGKSGSRMLSPDERADLAKAMLNLPFGAIKEATRIGIRNAVEKINVRDLYTGISTLPSTEGDDATLVQRQVGALAKLENEITDYVETAVSQNKAILPQSIKVTLGPIQMPPEVEDAITKDHESWLQTETAIIALEKLEKLVTQFNPSDVARLAALERLHMLAHNDVLKSYRNKFTQHEGVVPNSKAN